MISGILPRAPISFVVSGSAGRAWLIAAGTLRRVGALLWLAALAAIVPLSAHAAAWDLARLAEVISGAGFGTYRFAEERHLQFLTEPLHLEGTLSYTAEGKLVRRVTSPRPEQAVIDGNLLSIETNKVDPPVRVLLSDQPVLNALVVALRATLTGDVPLLIDHYEADLSGLEASWSLNLTPRAASLRAAVEEIRLQGSAHEIRTIEILETNGDRSVITISGKI